MRKLLIPCSLVGLTAVACWGASRGPNAPAQTTATPQAVPSEDAPPNGAASVDHEPLDLRSFTPLLEEPELGAVSDANDAGRPADAALLLSQLPPSADAAERARRYFLTGVLYTRASESGRARQAFLDASRFEGSLQADAWLRAGESFLAEGQAAEALAAVEQAHFENVEARQLLLQARSHAALGELDTAEELYRRTNDLAVGADVRMEWVRLEVQRCRKEGDADKRRALAKKALVDLAAVLLALPRDHALSIEGRQLSSQLVAWAGTAAPMPDRSANLARLAALLDANALEEAAELVVQISFEPRDWSMERCQYQSLLGKLRSLERKWGEAAEAVQPASEHCQEDAGLHARLLFNAGKYAAADGRDARAVRSYAELERLHPDSSLADDARLRAARSYKDMGVPARFVELLSSLPEDYPDGDMTWEGVLELALYRMERKDWAGAALILEGGARAVEAKDAARGPEFSGCERYFLARARGQLGKLNEELDEYQRIVEDLPLSYYMLHAYSRLHEADPARATRALDEGVLRARQRPFAFPYRVEYDAPEFKRALELLRVSEIVAGRQVLGRLGLGADGDQSILWGLALLYDRAGDTHQSFGIAQGKLSDWLAHYPEGDWERPWQLGFPRPYHSIVERESRSTGVPEWFIYGIMREESTFDPEAESAAAAYGLMQLIVPTARTIGQKAGLPYSPAALKRPSVNIALGSRVLSSLTKQFPDNPWLAIPGYNAGPGRPRRWLRERPDVDFDVWVELIPFRETRRYTKRVLSSRAAYAFVYERERAEAALLLPRRLTLP